MNIEKQIEFEQIKNKWKELAVTEYAKETIENAGIILSENELKRELRITTDAREMIEKCGNPPLQNVSEINQILEAAKKGECLSAYELERVWKIIVEFKRLTTYLARGKAYENSLAYYDENFEIDENLCDEISRQIRGGNVDDYASKDLQQIRQQIVKCEEEMKQKAEQVMKKYKDCMADNYCVVRNGRVCVPVKKEHKFKITGSVIDKSSTGSTLFMEPVSVAKYYDELQTLKIKEENEVYRILYTLSAMVADGADAIISNIKMLEKLDFIFSKGKLSLDLDACEPQINTERRIKLVDAWHPLMDKNKAVFLQFEIGGDVNGIVITGPNTGGKTVAIKTVMLNAMMAQCGLHVTCKCADICMNSSYLCDIGDGQNLSENLSTFSAHITNVLSVLKEISKDSLVIMDELGSGTDPTEGMGIAIAILEELRKSNALFLVTTHYPEVKEYAKRHSEIVNARMAFDKETLRPTYQMVIGEAGESCAFYIADRLGMPNSMLRVAIEAAYGKDAVENYHFQKEDSELEKEFGRRIIKNKPTKANSSLSLKFSIGDSVMIYPDKKIGIVCEGVNEKGVLRVQLPDKKIYINHKRVKLHVKASELYPEDYDFSIIFESKDNRKILHDLQRKLTDKEIIRESDEI